MGVDRRISVEAEGKVQQDKVKDLTHNMAPNPKPPLAIQDSSDAHPVKKDPEELEKLTTGSNMCQAFTYIGKDCQGAEHIEQ